MFTEWGVIKSGNEVLIGRTMFTISQIKASDPRQEQWSGYFIIPSGTSSHSTETLFRGRAHRLVLDDGRSGALNVVGFDGVTPGSTVWFNGTGPLE